MARRRCTEAQRLLMERRRKLLMQLEPQTGLPERHRTDSGDELDAVAVLSETEMNLSVAEIRSSEVSEIEDALRKIVDGTYGHCEMCGTSIPAARLKAAPWATLCLGCQRQFERTLGAEGDALAWGQIESGPMDEAAAGRFIRAYTESGG